MKGVCFNNVTGVLYYGDVAGDGVRGTDYVTELHSKSDLDKFLHQQEDDRVLTVRTTLVISSHGAFARCSLQLDHSTTEPNGKCNELSKVPVRHQLSV